MTVTVTAPDTLFDKARSARQEVQRQFLLRVLEAIGFPPEAAWQDQEGERLWYVRNSDGHLVELPPYPDGAECPSCLVIDERTPEQPRALSVLGYIERGAADLWLKGYYEGRLANLDPIGGVWLVDLVRLRVLVPMVRVVVDWAVSVEDLRC